MELFLIWICFAVTTGIIAAHKGRNGLGWGALGFLFSVFALIIVLALPAVKAEEKK